MLMAQNLVDKLPPDVWIIIFGSSGMSIPGLFDTSSLAPCRIEHRSWVDNDGWLEPDTTAMRKIDCITSNQIASSIVLVCRYFYVLATPMLYKSLSVRNYQTSLNLAQTLAEGSQIAKEDLLSLSMYPRRLEINFENDKFIPKRDYSHVATILSLCKGLRILLIRPGFNNIGGTSDLDIEAVRNNAISLRHLEFYYHHSGFTSSFLKNVGSFSQLEVLTITFQLGRDFSKESAIKVYLPCMHTLQICGGDPPDFLPWIITWRIPSFHRLYLLGRDDIGDFARLFDVFGPQITFIQCARASYIPPLLLQHTSVEQVIFRSTALWYIRPTHVPPSLRKVSINVRMSLLNSNESDSIYMRREMMELSKALDMLFKWPTPSLTSVRLFGIDSSTVERLRANSEYAEMWSRILEKCRSENLRVEYHDGELVDTDDLGRLTGVKDA
jgi:hypothetical protein